MDISSMSSMMWMFQGLPSQDQTQMQTDAMATVDTDGSGGISIDEAGETEFGSKIEENFDSIDTDGDGELTQTEISDFMQSKIDEMMLSFSGTGGAESSSLFDMLLDTLDGDGDGEDSDGSDSASSSSSEGDTASALEAYNTVAEMA